MLEKKALRRFFVVGLLLATTTATALAAHRVYIRHHYLLPHPGRHVGYLTAPRTVIVGNWGEVDFNVEPQQSRVYVDGVYLGIADDVNGWPSHARLKAGPHNVRIVAPNGKTYQTRIYVQPGKELNFDYRF